MLRTLRRRTYRARRVWHEVALALRRPFRVLAAMALLATAGIGLWALASQPLTEGMGGSVDLGPDSTAVLDVSSHGDLALAGLQDGDRLLALGGEPVTPARADRLVVQAPFEGPIGDTLAFRVEREGEVLSLEAVYGAGEIQQARRLGLSHRTIEGVRRVSLALVLVVFSVAGIVLLARSQVRGYTASLGTALLAAAGGFAYIAVVSHLHGGAPGVALLIGTLLGTFAIVGALPTVNSALVRFPDGRHTPRWSRHVRALSILGILLLIAFVIGNAIVESGGRDTGRIPFIVVQGILVAILALSAVALAQKYRQASDPVVRQQMKWVLLPLGAFVFVTLFGIITGSIERLHAHSSPAGYLVDTTSAVLAWLTAAAIPLGVFAGLFRFRPWDADLWIARSAAVGLATLGLAAVFAGGAEAMRLTLRSSFGSQADPIAAALAAVISLFAFNPVREWFTKRAEADLERTREILGERLPLVLAGRQVVASPGEIGRVAIRGLRDALQTDRAAVIDLDPEGWEVVAVEGVGLDEALAWADQTLDRRALPACAEQVWEDPTFVLRVPLRSAEDELVGVLALGTHGKGRGYSTAEREAVDGVSRPLAEALRVAERREDMHTRDHARIAGLVERLLAAPGGDGTPTEAEPRA